MKWRLVQLNKMKLVQRLKNKFEVLFSKMEKISFSLPLAGLFVCNTLIWSWVFYILEIKSPSNLVPVYAIIGAILSAFTIEGLKDKNQAYKINIFFRFSYLSTIFILFLLSLFLLFLSSKIKFISILSFTALLFLLCFTVYAVSQIILIMLSSAELWDKHIDLFKHKIKKLTQFSKKMDERSKEFNKFIKESKCESRYLLSEYPNQFYLKSLVEGTIINIDVDKLKNIFEDIKREKIKTFTKQKTNSSSLSDPKSLRENDVRSDSRDISLNIQIRQKITQREILLSYNKDVGIDRFMIEKKLNDALTIERVTISDEVQEDLKNYKLMIKKNIEEENIDKFEKHFNLYYVLVEEFLNQLGTYSYEKARIVINVFLLDWLILDWLRDHIMDVFKYVVQQSKKDNQSKIYDLMLNDINQFNYNIVGLAMDKKDHLFFQIGFSLWIQQLYYLLEQKNIEKDKSIENHFEFLENKLIPTVFFKKQIIENEEGYNIYLLKILKDIFGCILRKDKKFNYLNKFKDILDQIISNASPYHNYDINIEKVFSNHESYDSRKLQFLFGLGAYLDALPISEDQNGEQMSIIKEQIEQFILSFINRDLKNLINIYSLINKREVDAFWIWYLLDYSGAGTWKIRETNAKGYVLKLMLCINENQFNELRIEDINNQTLSCLENLRFLNVAGSIAGIDQKLKELEATDEEKQTVNNFFKKILEYQHKKRIVCISQEPLEVKKKQEFIDKFQENFNKKSYMRTLFKKKEIKETEEIKEISVWKLNEIEDKSYFVSFDSGAGVFFPTVSSQLSKRFSDSCLEGENKLLQSKILNKCRKKKVEHSNFIKELKDRKWLSTEVIIVSDRYFYNMMKDFPFKIENNEGDNKNIFDYYFMCKNKKIFLKFDYLIRDKKVDVMIFDTSKLPILETFNPVEPQNEKFDFEFLSDIGVSIGIGVYSHNKDLMDFIIKNPPEWLKEQGNEKQQKEFLKLRVNIKVLQALHLNWVGITEPIGEYFVISDLKKKKTRLD